jgi:hypothetical protein
MSKFAQVPDRRFTGLELQTFGNALVRLLVKMALVPVSEALRIGPVSDEPDFLGPVERAEDFHLNNRWAAHPRGSADGGTRP